jgi:hypothetical protein
VQNDINASKIRVLSSVAFFAIMKHLNNFWIYSMLVTCLWENFSYIYSKTCIKKSPLGKQKTGLWRQVTFKFRFILYKICYRVDYPCNLWWYTVNSEINAFIYYCDLRKLNQPGLRFLINAKRVQCTCLWENFSYIYSKTCIKKSPLGKQKTGLWRQVIFKFRLMRSFITAI